MRFVATVFLWLVTTVLLAVAVPTMWAERNVVSEDGYAALAAAAAQDPKLQSAMASELTTQILAFAADNGYGSLNSDLVHGVVAAYTGNDGFPGQFAQANRIAHRWMFTDSVRSEDGSGDRWLIDIAPMLNDSSIKETLGNLDLDVPQTLDGADHGARVLGVAARPAAGAVDMGSVGECRSDDTHRGVRVADAGGGPLAG